MSGKTKPYKKISNWEVLTPKGFKSFSGIKKVNKEYSLKFTTEFDKEITCSGGHQLYVKRELEGQESEEMFCFADMIEPYTDKIKNKVGEYETVIEIEKTEKEIDLFDLVDVEDGYEYYANDLLSHNCAHIENFSELWTGLQPTISCVTGDTLILTDNGFEKIEDFHKTHNVGDYFKLEIPIYGKNGMEKTSHGYVSPESDTIIIRTKHGHEIECTLKHPLFVYQNGKNDGVMIESRNITIGNKLRIQTGMKCYGTNTKNITLLEAKNTALKYSKSLIFDENLDLDSDILTANEIFVKNYLKELIKICCVETIETINKKIFKIEIKSKGFIKKLNLLFHNDGYKSYILKEKEKIFLCVPFEETKDNFYWDEIVSIDKSKNKTYDFTVPKTHTFLQNGILGSNTGGSAILISTPLGIGNQFHSIWAKATDKNFDPANIKTNEEGSNKFYAIELPWTVHPERDQEWYESQCSELGNDPRRISQELLCAFNSSGNNFIDSKILEYLKTQLKTPIARYGNGNDMNIWEYAKPGHKYIISADVARGDSEDFSTAWIIDADTNICVADFKSKIPPDRFAEFLVDIGEKYNKAFIVNEINSVGVATSFALKTLKYQNLYFEKLFNGSIENNYTQDMIGDLIPGFNTNVKSRVEIMTKFEAAIRNKEIQVYSDRLIKELETFIWDGKKAKALKGYNDDLIMALAIGVNFINWGAARSTYDDGASIMAMIQGMSKNSRTLEQLTKQQSEPNTVDWGNIGFDLPSKGSIYSNSNTKNNIFVGGTRIPSWIKQS